MLEESDKKDLKDLLNEAVTSHIGQVDSAVGKHIGKVNERLAGVESTLGAVKETVDVQAQKCTQISKDLYDRTNKHGEEIVGMGKDIELAIRCSGIADTKALEAKEEVKIVNKKMVGGLIVLLLQAIALIMYLLRKMLPWGNG